MGSVSCLGMSLSSGLYHKSNLFGSYFFTVMDGVIIDL